MLIITHSLMGKDCHSSRNLYIHRCDYLSLKTYFFSIARVWLVQQLWQILTAKVARYLAGL